jgi:hypothetical protein
MRHNLILRSSILLICSFIFIYSSCKKEPYILPYEEAGGYVIGKETCNTDVSKDYWLLDMTVYPNTKQYGDTLVFNGTTYTNVIKVLGLADELKAVGKKVGLDFNISGSKITTVGCNISSPSTYQLKEATIVNQFKIP